MSLRRTVLFAALSVATGCAFAASDVPTGPLPRTVVPSDVALELKIDPAQARFSGHVDLHVDIAQATATIWMHGKGLAIHKATYTPANGKPVALTAAEVDVSGVLKLSAAKPLPTGTTTSSRRWSPSARVRRSRASTNRASSSRGT